MDNLNKFNSDIVGFRNGNEYDYNFNSVGNLLFNVPSEKVTDIFVKVNALEYQYDQQKIHQLFNLNFEELIATNDENVVDNLILIHDLENQISQLNAKNAQLNVLVDQLQNLKVQNATVTKTSQTRNQLSPAPLSSQPIQTLQINGGEQVVVLPAIPVQTVAPTVAPTVSPTVAPTVAPSKPAPSTDPIDVIVANRGSQLRDGPGPLGRVLIN